MVGHSNLTFRAKEGTGVHLTSPHYCSIAILTALVLFPAPVETAQAGSRQALIDQGRYLAQIAGCNDCHTPGYMASNGNVPEAQWLTGDTLGWRGPWGTTYAPNLRLFMQNLSEQDWLTLARNAQYRPPMPWFNLRQMSDQDLRSFYQYVRHIGPAGQPAPAYVPPDKEPAQPYVQFPSGGGH